jgi:hypothetical protein
MNKFNIKEPLYRKVNTKTFNVKHDFGGDFSDSRHKKKETLEVVKGTMHGKKNRGLDYTPLFRFLLSKVDSKWDNVFNEAKARLDKTEPIFWLVALQEVDKKEVVRVGESTYYSGMFVDEDGILKVCNPKLTPSDLKHYCDCCTHTFNGVVY